MGTITSGVGLISGLNIKELVDQLIAIDAKPLTQLKTRITTAQTQQQAYMEISARLVAAKSAIDRLSQPSSFSVKTASSSNENVLTATADSTTPLDTYSFTVKSLVTTHQLVSATGFASRTATIGAGTLTFESGNGSVSPSTSLSALNGSQGIRRGVIRVTDRSGASADIDLRAATTVDEVLSAINTQRNIRVRAEVSGDHLVLTDKTGLGSGALSVADLGGGFAAADLGIAGSSATGEVVGSDVVNLSDSTLLSQINDGNGLRKAAIGDDLRFTLKDGRQFDVNLSGTLRFGTKLAELNDGRGVGAGTIRVTNRSGNAATIDLSSAQTLGDVVSAINASGLSVSASLSGSKISISDSSGGTSSNLKIEDVSGTAAADLGILADTDKTGIVGSSIHRIDTLGGVLRAIRYATGNEGALQTSISPDGNRLVFTDTTVGTGETSAEALNGSRALEDLGLNATFAADGTLSTRHLIAGLDTVLLASLNGGQGVDTSDLQITRRVGGSDTSYSVDLTGAQSLQDVVDAINAVQDGGGAPVFQAEISQGQTGITIKDAGGGVITAFSGQSATDLKLTANSSGSASGGDLQLRYISENTLLSSLNQGAGVRMGTFRIAASDGKSASVTLNETTHKTLGDVMRSINTLNLGVSARINADGDGLELEDSAGGTGSLTVTEDKSGATAADLGILGSPAAGERTIGTSQAKSLEITGSDTLDTLVSKINAAKLGVRASIINDGSTAAPYRLILTSANGGTRGELSFSTGTTGLSFNTLSQAKDATVVIGDPDSSSAMVVTSTSNTIKNVVDGLTLQLKGTSSEPVQITVDRDVEQIVSDVKTFMKTFNDAMDRTNELTSYNADTNERGVLLGDSAVLQVRDRLYAAVTSTLAGAGADLNDLTDVGITIGNGAQLQFAKGGEERLRAALSEDPDAVSKLFTQTTVESGKTVYKGIAAKINKEIDALTNTTDGLITRQRESIQDRVDLYNARSTQLQTLLDKKEERLLKQFQAMESSLAKLQAQQSSLTSLASLASAASSA